MAFVAVGDNAKLQVSSKHNYGVVSNCTLMTHALPLTGVALMTHIVSESCGLHHKKTTVYSLDLQHTCRLNSGIMPKGFKRTGPKPDVLTRRKHVLSLWLEDGEVKARMQAAADAQHRTLNNYFNATILPRILDQVEADAKKKRD